MLAHGHPGAGLYPFGMMWDEADLVAQRINNEAITAGILVQSAIYSALSEDGGKQFEDLIKRLSGE